MSKQHTESTEHGQTTGRTLCGREMPRGSTNGDTCQACMNAEYRAQQRRLLARRGGGGR